MRYSRLAATAAAVLVHPLAANAAGAGGGALPWDRPLTVLMQDLTGPFAFTISLLAFVAAGVVLIFGGEVNDFIRRLLYVVMVSAMLVSVTNVANALGITGALV
jgi:type IV secretory pathway VirB2 component (pilin)